MHNYLTAVMTIHYHGTHRAYTAQQLLGIMHISNCTLRTVQYYYKKKVYST